MSDEYIAQLIMDELRESCPGETGCHGCQSWCPKCGSVGHVCDDPGCDAHRRDTDVLRDLEGSRKRTAGLAAECKKIEETLLSMEGDRITDVRIELRRAATRYEREERENRELEDELREITAPGSMLVPRIPGAKHVPKDR